MELCPDCNNEILPYLKTGEIKRIEEVDETFPFTLERSLISYQCYYCIACKVVFYNEHEEFVFKSLLETRKEVANGNKSDGVDRGSKGKDSTGKKRDK